MRSLHIAATGMQAQQTNVEVISNNIANISTTGFKRRRAEFQDLLYQNIRRNGSQLARSLALVFAPPPFTASANRAICNKPKTALISRSAAMAISRCACHQGKPLIPAMAPSGFRQMAPW